MNGMQALMQQMMKSNPMFQRAAQMAEGKSPDELKQTAMNLCEQRGINLDEAMKQFEGFMNNLKRNNGIS